MRSRSSCRSLTIKLTSERVAEHRPHESVDFIKGKPRYSLAPLFRKVSHGMFPAASKAMVNPLTLSAALVLAYEEPRRPIPRKTRGAICGNTAEECGACGGRRFTRTAGAGLASISRCGRRMFVTAGPGGALPGRCHRGRGPCRGPWTTLAAVRIACCNYPPPRPGIFAPSAQ